MNEQVAVGVVPENTRQNVTKMVVESRLFFIVLFIMWCSVLDYAFTLNHLASGYKELNPIMDYLFTLGYQQAFIFKYCMTATGVVVLCALSGRLLITRIFNCIAALYGILIFYHLYLLRYF